MSMLRVGFAAWFLLAMLQVVWHGVLRPPPSAMLVPAAIVLAILPLALPLLARSAARRLWWAAAVSLLYFSHGVMQAWAASGLVRALGWMELVLAVAVVGMAGGQGRAIQRKEHGGSQSDGPTLHRRVR